MHTAKLLLPLMLSALLLSARNDRGAVSGKVANPEGTVRIVATSLQTREKFSAMADGTGAFTLSSLPAGSYGVLISNGTGTAIARRQLEVRAGETVRLNAKLEAVHPPSIDGRRTRVHPVAAAPAADLPPVLQQFGESSRYLNGVVLVDDNHGWAVGDPRWDQAAHTTKGTIINTTDGGVTWSNQDPGVTVALSGLFFLNASQGWAVGDNGTIVRTTDGGAHWTQEPVDTGDSFVSVFFTDAQNGWAASYTPIQYWDFLGDFVDWQASIWHSTDGGQTWSHQTVPASAMLLKRVFFVNATTGFAAGTKRTGYDGYGNPTAVGGIYGTTNGGQTWNEIFTTSQGLTFTSLCFTDANNGWASGFALSSYPVVPCTFHTSDGGRTWQTQNLNAEEASDVQVRDLRMLDTNRGYAVGTSYLGDGTAVWRTLDGGATWTGVAMADSVGDYGYWGMALTADRVLIVGDRDTSASSSEPWNACAAEPGDCSELFTQANISPDYKFEDVFFTDRQHGWAAGTRTFSTNMWGQEIFHTADGGNTWQTQYEDAPLDDIFSYHHLESVYFTDALHGWAVGTSRLGSDYYTEHNAILHTADGGATWSEQGQELYHPWGLEFAAVQFLDQQNGWALARLNFPSEDVFLAHTINGGSNWSWVDTGIAGDVLLAKGGMRFVDAQHGCFAGSDVAGCTRDGGATWTQATVTCGGNSCDPNAHAVAFADSLHGWIGGGVTMGGPGDGALYTTTDGGANWSVNTPPAMSNWVLEAIQFLTPSTGWLSGDGGLLFQTTDAGADWQPVGTGTGYDLLGLNFTDATHGWIVGDFGTILSYAGDRNPAGEPALFAAANAASYTTQTAPAAWISLFGANLSATTRSWVLSDFVNGKLPTKLDGVSVLVNGSPAYLSYISPGQINAMFPDDGSTGQVSVQVANAQGSSGTLPVNKAIYSPALFRLSVEQGNYVIAQTIDGDLVGNYMVGSDLGTPGQVRTANPGEIVTLYGTGFGPTSPETPSDTLVGVPAKLAAAVTFTIGGSPAVVEWAGIIGSGLYQFNIQIPPSAPSGDLVIAAEIGGYRSQGDSVISVGQD
jgi:uncharacterized protein (TIGR03437 family)